MLFLFFLKICLISVFFCRLLFIFLLQLLSSNLFFSSMLSIMTSLSNEVISSKTIKSATAGT